MRRPLVLLVSLGLAACSGMDVMAYMPMGPPPAACPAATSVVVCEGSVATTCEGGTSRGVADCRTTHESCAPGLGCRACVPHVESCDGETLEICRADGSGYDPIHTCDPPTEGHCSDSGCVDLCARAAEMRSYVGCEYLAVPTLNPELSPEFDFAVAVTNPNLVGADVTITQGGTPVLGTLDDGTTASTFTVPPGGVTTVRLPWVDALKGDTTTGSPPFLFPSVLARGAAFRLVASVPVIVDQFDPLEFEIPRDCANEAGSTSDHHCFSFTNDASLLLPTTALTGSYVAISRPTLFQTVTRAGMPPDSGGTPGFVTIVGADETPVMVAVTTHAHVAASADGTTVASMAPGETARFMLGKGDVLQLVSDIPTTCPVPPERETSPEVGTTRVDYCPLGDDWDLTGTEIRTAGHVEVISGHACAFVPFDRWACDHLEEQMFPVETWDSDAVVSLTKQVRGEPNLVRVVSAADDNVVSFDPPSVHAPVTLGRFEHVEVVATVDVHVTATHPIAVAQFLVGQDYAGLGSSGARAVGDPSMGLAAPSAQERSDYVFLVPSTYTQSYVNLTAPAGTLVTLDGVRVSGFVPIGASGLSTVKVAVRGGVHHAAGERPFGLLVYGYAAYTSYLYTGGLDFRVINPPI